VCVIKKVIIQKYMYLDTISISYYLRVEGKTLTLEKKNPHYTGKQISRWTPCMVYPVFTGFRAPDAAMYTRKPIKHLELT
jgi:hypothetical protein